MPISTVVVIGLAASFIGVVLGVLGAGGGMLTVPYLVYVLGIAPPQAVAMSLLVVGLSSVAALVGHARAERVSWRAGITFGSASMVGSFSGGRLAAFLASHALMLVFASVMLATAIAMIRKRDDDADADEADPSDSPRAPPMPLIKVLPLGFVVGVVAGLVGAGGGFMIVPALVLVGRMQMRRAVGTSLFVIAMQSVTGFLGHVSHVHVDVRTTIIVTVFTALGGIAGSRLAPRFSQSVLRRGFAFLVALIGVTVMAAQIYALATRAH